MFTQPASRRVIPPSGSKHSKIVIVGGSADAFDDKQLRPFSGPGGSVLEQCLHAAGLIRGELYITNVVPLYTNASTIWKYYDVKKDTFTTEGQQWVQTLQDQLNSSDANIVVACGKMAMRALTGSSKLNQYRGYVMHTTGLDRIKKVICTHHPMDTIRGMYTYRHMIVCDLKKAKQESQTAELNRPQRQLILEYENVGEMIQWLDFFEHRPIVSVDIEVINFEVSCISFSSTPDVACSIPVASIRNELDELQVWRAIQRVLGNSQSVKVFQNGIFDIHFLLTRNGIEVRGPVHDTMIAHSIMYPELPKGLGFLGSIYCGATEYWKDSVKFNNIKEES